MEFNFKFQHFIPIEYRTPSIDVNMVYFVELFDHVSVIGKKWLKSEAKKEDTAEALSRYNGWYFVLLCLIY